MLKRLLKILLRGRTITVKKTSDLEEGTARYVTIGDIAAGGTRILLCRVEGKVHALDSLCPHQGGFLEKGALTEGKYALCPVHNFLFDAKSGKVIQGSCAAAKTYRVNEKGDEATIHL